MNSSAGIRLWRFQSGHTKHRESCDLAVMARVWSVSDSQCVCVSAPIEFAWFLNARRLNSWMPFSIAPNAPVRCLLLFERVRAWRVSSRILSALLRG